MPRKPSGGSNQVRFYVDMESINDLIGTIFATEKMGTGSRYLQRNIKASFNHADNEFKREITTTALASGQFSHMFEWGTKGINDAPTDMSQAPNEETARLWRTFMTQTQRSSTIDFTYKPSVAIVPKPTEEKTGIPEDITSKLSDHVFWNKAKVMETGQTVTVKRINAKKLFIPLAYKGITGPKAFVMVNGPTNPTPGRSEFYRSHAGTFTSAFKTFWEGRGSVLMQEQVEGFYNTDLDRAVDMIRNQRPGRWTPPNKVNQQGQIERTKERVMKWLERAAMERESASSAE